MTLRGRWIRLLVAAAAAAALSGCPGHLEFDPNLVGGGTGGAPVGPGGPAGAGGAGGAVGGVGEGGSDGTQASCPDGFDVVATVFRGKCGGCHGADSPAKELDLASPGLGARLVDVVSTCNGRPLLSSTLVGGLPDGHLLDKLAGPVPGCGVRMPAGGSPVPARDMACVREWALNAIAGAATGGDGGQP